MLGYPPEPTSVLPRREGFKPEEWTAQLIYEGWRIVIHNNKVYTRKGKLLPIETGYLSLGFDYQLDGEIINPQKHTERSVLTAIKKRTHKIEISDIYLPFAKDMGLGDRIIFLREELRIFVPCLDVFSYESIFNTLHNIKRHGQKGIVIKRLNSVYKLSRHCPTVDSNWVKVK